MHSDKAWLSQRIRAKLTHAREFEKEYTVIDWWPGAAAPGHPWPTRHRCIPAQWPLPAIHGLRGTGASLHNGRSRPSMAYAAPVHPCTMAAPGHPWPTRHRCIPAQWNRTTDTRIFSALKINKLLIWLDEAICGTVWEKHAETTGCVRLAERAEIRRCSAGVPQIRMRKFHQQTPRIQPSRRALRNSGRLSGGLK
jgi:hypothetical protein